MLLKEQVWVCKIEGERSIRRWSPETLAIVENRPHGTSASHKHLADLTFLPGRSQFSLSWDQGCWMPQLVAVAEIASQVTLRE